MNLVRMFYDWTLEHVFPKLTPRYHYQSGSIEDGWYFAELQNRNLIICTATIKNGEIVFDNEGVLAGIPENERDKYLEFVHEMLDPWLTGDLRKIMNDGCDNPNQFV